MSGGEVRQVGLYVDPKNPGHTRWWDGEGWSERGALEVGLKDNQAGKMYDVLGLVVLRLKAGFIDTLLMGLGAVMTVLGGTTVIEYERRGIEEDIFFWWLLGVGVVLWLAVAFYNFLWRVPNTGQSVGEKIVKIKVVQRYSDAGPSLLQACARYVLPRAAVTVVAVWTANPFLVLGAVGCSYAFMFWAKDGRGGADFVCGTRVAMVLEEGDFNEVRRERPPDRLSGKKPVPRGETPAPPEMPKLRGYGESGEERVDL